jgi:hypothetical protein
MGGTSIFLLYLGGDCDDGEVGRMDGFGRGHRSTRRKPGPTPICQPQIPLAMAPMAPVYLLQCLWNRTGLKNVLSIITRYPVQYRNH